MSPSPSKELDNITPKELRLEWIALYEDGEKVVQNYGKGRENGERDFGDIDQEKMSLFILRGGDQKFVVDVKNQNIVIGDKVFRVEFPIDKSGNKKNGKLVYFRRNTIEFSSEDKKVEVRYCIGLQATVDMENYQQYVFINADGTFTLSQKK